MDCEKHSRRIPEYIRGDLGEDEIAELEIHIASCETCRAEVEDLRWFLTGVRNNAPDVSAGHISSRLLYDFAEKQTILGPDIVSRIENHLSACETCRRDLDRIDELIAVEVPGTEATARPAAVRSGWRFGFNFRTVATSLAFAITFVVVAWLAFKTSTEPTYDATLVPSIARYDVAEVPLREPVRGESERPPAVQLKEISADKIVLKMELDLFDVGDRPASVSIVNEAGNTVWSGTLDALPVKTGTILLLVDRSTFAPGLYTISVASQNETLMGLANIDL